jgi:uncharacterized protein YkwD
MLGRGPRLARLRVSPLENRITPAVSATLLNGVLTVLGDTSPNNLQVSLNNGMLTVSPTGQSFASSAVSAIVIDGGAGDDTIVVGGGITQQCWIFGGSGNDNITASGFGNDLIYGGNGNDTIASGAGNDTIFGNAGIDVLTDNQGVNSINQGSANQTAALDATSSAIVTLVNQQRAAAGIAPLSVNPVLTFAAQLHSNQMAQQSTVQGIPEAMAHTLMGVALPSLTSRVVYAGYEYIAVGENIAYGFAGPNEVMNGWMNSSGHRANLLDPNYTEIGVGVRLNPNGTPYYTQVFGRPITPSATTPPATATPPAATTPPPAATTPPASGSSTAPATFTPVEKVVVAGADAGMTPTVVVYNAATGARIRSFDAYDSGFRGGVRVATGDVNGDGFDDIITGAGAGGGPHVKVFDGKTGSVLTSFFAYGAGFAGGVFVAAGDVNGDGHADIITGAGAGGGPHVRVISGANGQELASYFAYPAGFLGGVNVAAGDVNGDGKADVITGAGAGGGPLVRVFNAATSTPLFSFYAYATTFAGGVTVAAGDVNGDGRADIITGAGAGGGPHVQVFSGADRTVLRSFFAYPANFTGGVRVAARDQDGDGRADILVGGGAGAANPVRAYSGVTLFQIRSYSAFDPSFLGGCYIG